MSTDTISSKPSKSAAAANNRVAKLLKAERPLFDMTILELERLTSSSNSLQKLDAEIEQKFLRFCKRNLNLNLSSKPTGEQIYKELMFLLWRQNDLVLKKHLKLKSKASLDKILTACIDFALELDVPTTIFRLKKSKARELLLAHPPTSIIKFFGYSSVEELLKKEKLLEIYGALRFAEGDEWLTSFNKQYSKLKASDFTRGKTKIIKMPIKWAPLTKNFIIKKKHNITHLKELGVVLVLETDDKELRHGIVLKALPLIVHYLYEIKLYSNFFKLKAGQVPDNQFGQIIEETIIADPKLNFRLARHKLHWRVVQRYFGKLQDAKKHKEVFQPHLQPEDLHWDKAVSILAKAIPELAIWKDVDYVGLQKDGVPLPLNFMDLSLSFANKNRYKDHLFYHFRESLWNEIFARYMGQQELESQLLLKLNNALVAPKKGE